ncbi:MAG: hypothetical protein AAFY29_13825 [Pseudomonadota bacterium]
MMIRAAFLSIACVTLTMLQTSAVAQTAENRVAKAASTVRTLPDAIDRELVMEACTRCHGIDLVLVQPRAPDEWLQVVSMMVGSGMALTDDEYGRIVTYLSENLSYPVRAAK